MRLIICVVLVVLLNGQIPRGVCLSGLVRPSTHLTLSLLGKMRWILVISTVISACRLCGRLVLLGVLPPLFIIGRLRRDLWLSLAARIHWESPPGFSTIL